MDEHIVPMDKVAYLVTTFSTNWVEDRSYVEGHFASYSAAKLFARHNSACGHSWTCSVIDVKTNKVVCSFTAGKEN
jgi:hypothetical protein